MLGTGGYMNVKGNLIIGAITYIFCSTFLIAQARPTTGINDEKIESALVPPSTAEAVRPVTLQQSPPKVPRVSYTGSQLTIDAVNSTLGELLSAISRITGAIVDVPPAANAERVVARLGPGAPREILTTLLSETKFDYIISGSSEDPLIVKTVMVMVSSTKPASADSPDPSLSRSRIAQSSIAHLAPEPLPEKKTVNEALPDPVTIAPQSSDSASVEPLQIEAHSQPKPREQMIEVLTEMYRQRQAQQIHTNGAPQQ
jgi:hypothetical protein